MKKSFIFVSVFVGILMVSLVSAGWWSDLFNSPPSVTGNVINTRGMDLDLNKLSEGVQLSNGWNYWFIWKDSEMPVAQLVSGLDANSYRYVYEYNPQTRKTTYWYGDSNSKNRFDKFVNGNNYAIYMLSSAEWKYSGNSPDSDKISHLEIEGDGMLDPSIDFNNKQFGGGVIRFKEQGDIKAGISGGSFGFQDSILIFTADKARLDKGVFEIKGDGMLHPSLDFDNDQFGGGAIRFKEKGEYKSGISGGSFGFQESFLIFDADKIQLEKLTGSGNAYACIDSQGNLFRSDSPCR